MRRLLLVAMASMALMVSGCAMANVLPDGRILLLSATGNKLFDPGQAAIAVTGSTSTPRIAAASAALPDGRVLVTGGIVDSKPLSSSEIWDPKTGTFTSTGDMTVPRSLHTATTLADGRVLIVGGGDLDTSGGEGLPPLASAELFDPATGTFSATGDMADGRLFHTATLLADGRVLIAGGGAATAQASALAEIYDPQTGTFSSAGALGVARMLHTATRLADGRVLITGGVGASTSELSSSSAPTGALTSAEVFDPVSGSFAPTGDLGVGRAAHTATLLRDGHVLVAGGMDQISLTASEAGASSPPSASATTAELYDPVAGTFSPTGGMDAKRAFHVAAAMPDGRVLVIGGEGSADGTTPTDMLGSAQAYDPSTGSFSAVDVAQVAK